MCTTGTKHVCNRCNELIDDHQLITSIYLAPSVYICRMFVSETVYACCCCYRETHFDAMHIYN